MEGNMLKCVSKLVLAFSLVATPALALPVGPQTEIPDAPNTALIKILSKSQKSAARRACRAQYGARLAFVTFTRNRYVCHFRKSTKTLTKQAARNCRKSGLRLARINSIKIKGNQSITRYTCKRR
jgi:hypothetical protein